MATRTNTVDDQIEALLIELADVDNPAKPAALTPSLQPLYYALQEACTGTKVMVHTAAPDNLQIVIKRQVYWLSYLQGSSPCYRLSKDGDAVRDKPVKKRAGWRFELADPTSLTRLEQALATLGITVQF
jgi:hypothetical protein